MNPSVSLHTLGCKLNHAETGAIAARFGANGFAVVDFGLRSDVVVINSCTVTETANRECRQLVRRALRANPDAFVIVTGCYAQLQPEQIASIEGVDLVLGSAEKFRIFDIEHSFEKRRIPCVVVGELDASTSFGAAYTGGGGSLARAYLKVQDGCDYTCSFCTIPIARGGSRSHSVAAAIDDAQRIVDAGYQEIVLTGVNVGDFNDNGRTLADLLIGLHSVRGLVRLRISSIEPNLLTDQILDIACGSDRLMPHFHVPLQSGSDRILGMMRRRYKSDLYVALVDRILQRMPDAAIGVDVIVGFPGEDDKDFAITYDLLNALDVAYLHVFTYSERQNTPAAVLAGVVPVAERRRRTRMLRGLSQKKRTAHAMRHMGQQRPVLFESADSGAMIQGYTDNYIRVSVPFHASLIGTVCPTILREYNGELVEGDVL